jgi:hypothetical protein
VIAVLAAAELEDAGQLKHMLSAEAPELVEYLPAMQPVQVLSAEATGVVEYLPIPNRYTAKAKLCFCKNNKRRIIMEYLPAPQSMHELATVALVVMEYLPAPQLKHEAAPITALNFPAPHATHGPPFGPVWPALH